MIQHAFGKTTSGKLARGNAGKRGGAGEVLGSCWGGAGEGRGGAEEVLGRSWGGPGEVLDNYCGSSNAIQPNQNLNTSGLGFAMQLLDPRASQTFPAMKTNKDFH